MEESSNRFYNHAVHHLSGHTPMPTYEYVCKSCGEHLEVFQSFKDKPLKKHPDCGGDLQKRFHASGIVFKGSGFYATDSKAAASSKPADSKDTKKTADKSVKSEKSEKSGESKPKAEAATKGSKDS